MRHRLLISARSLLLGWATLFVLTSLAERPLLAWTTPLLDASWLATVQLAVECVVLAATGWIVGRWNQYGPIPVVIAFAAMLAVRDFGLVPAINIRWLVQLAVDSAGNARYLESLVTAAATQALLFASLITGARLSRPRQAAPMSIIDETKVDMQVDKMDDHEW
jgi:hypothetical protein